MRRTLRYRESLRDALEALLQAVRNGEEFPDACSWAARHYDVDYVDLRNAYDQHFEDQP